MPQPWIKLHTGLVSNPKVMSLPADVFKVWILTLVETKRYNENGVVPPLPQLAFAIHVHPKWLATHIETLITANLVERRDDALVVHDWDDWQRGYPSEMRAAVAERVSRHRTNKRVTS